MPSDHYFYAGTTNAMPNVTDISLAFTDWTGEDDKLFGYFATTTDSAHCKEE